MQRNGQTGTEATGQVLYMALELSNRTWKLGFSDGSRLRKRTVAAGDQGAVLSEIAGAKAKFGLDGVVRVRSCYEAGRDGFWLHRWLRREGIENEVVDSASIEVKRRARQVKTDRVDVEKLVRLLLRYHGGEGKALSIVHVPSVVEEDQRRLHRERGRLLKERTQHSNRVQSLLVAQGVRIKFGANFVEQVEGARLWDGGALQADLKAELVREWERYQVVAKQVQELEALQRQRVSEGPEAALALVEQLMELRGVGWQSAWVLVMEFFGWRRFANRRELAALAGLTPTPYDSGDRQREQGISKAGNRRVRALMIELGWFWLRYQPQSELSQWFTRRYAHGGPRMRRIGIVALARKLLIALWRYLETDIVPAGAMLKPAARVA
jgi:transposase